MARLQILELPEGADDDRPPFVLVIDQARAEDFYPATEHGNTSQAVTARLITEHPLDAMAEQIGARAVLLFEETIDIPANEVSIGPDGYPIAIQVKVEGGFEKFGEQLHAKISEALARRGREP